MKSRMSWSYFNLSSSFSIMMAIAVNCLLTEASLNCEFTSSVSLGSMFRMPNAP
ncbi:hypothetical protein D3C83_289860 [compost metagenome]